MNIEILPLCMLVDGVVETLFIAVTTNADMPPRAVGHVGLCASSKCAGIRQLYVAEGCRQQGIGTKLMERCIEEAVTAKCTAINLCVAHDNKQVIPFYERLGFFMVADTTADDIWMALPLIPP